MLLYNTLHRRKEEFRRPQDGPVGIYTCGPTVYDVVHIGNLRAFLTYDLLRRTLEHKGYKVRHVMNITDVEDKSIRGMAREGLSLAGLARGNGNPEAFARRPVFSESRLGHALGPQRVLQSFPSPSFLVRVGGIKLARYPRDDGGIDYELYDVRSDPHERENLFDPDSDTSRQLIELVESYDERGKRLRAEFQRGAPMEPPVEVFLDPRQEKKLRALGYLK